MKHSFVFFLCTQSCHRPPEISTSASVSNVQLFFSTASEHPLTFFSAINKKPHSKRSLLDFRQNLFEVMQWYDEVWGETNWNQVFELCEIERQSFYIFVYSFFETWPYLNYIHIYTHIYCITYISPVYICMCICIMSIVEVSDYLVLWQFQGRHYQRPFLSSEKIHEGKNISYIV